MYPNANRVAPLLENASTTGSWTPWVGGLGTFTVEGTFGGATVSLQLKSKNGTAINVGDAASLAAAGMCSFEVPCGEIRAAVTGGSPSGLYAYAESLEYDD